MGSPDTIFAPLSLQRKEGALRVRASGDPAAVQQLMRAIKDPATTGLHTLRSRVDVADIEVIEPEWNRLCRKFSEHAADRLPTSGEPLTRIGWTGFVVRFLPAKKLAVESKRLLPV